MDILDKNFCCIIIIKNWHKFKDNITYKNKRIKWIFVSILHDIFLIVAYVVIGLFLPIQAVIFYIRKVINIFQNILLKTIIGIPMKLIDKYLLK